MKRILMEIIILILRHRSREVRELKSTLRYMRNEREQTRAILMQKEIDILNLEERIKHFRLSASNPDKAEADANNEAYRKGEIR